MAPEVMRDCERGSRFALRLEAGMTHVNDLPNCPFGGEKNGGLGRYNGQWAIEDFTTVRWVSVRHAPIRYPIRAAATPPAGCSTGG